MTSPLLSVRGVHTYYGHVAALKGVDLEVGDGEIVDRRPRNAFRSAIDVGHGRRRLQPVEIAADGQLVADERRREIARSGDVGLHRDVNRHGREPRLVNVPVLRRARREREERRAQQNNPPV